MKKKVWILGIIIFVLVLLIPLPMGVYRDGGTRVYRALTYTVVDWNRMVSAEEIYSEVKLYFPPKCYDSIDGLWAREAKNIEQDVAQNTAQTESGEYEFLAIIREIYGETSVEVEPVQGSPELNSANRISFGIASLEELPVYRGCLVSVKYNGEIMESYPAQIVATGWSLAGDWRQEPAEDPWTDAEFRELDRETAIIAGWITEIYADAFFLTGKYPDTIPTLVRGALDPEWNLGDFVTVYLENASYSADLVALKGDLVAVEAYNQYSNIPALLSEPIFGYLDTEELNIDYFDEVICYKPVIYLYPREETSVNVELDLQGDFLCTYPAYRDGWTVTAQPDGTLTDEAGKVYNYLYWEGSTQSAADLSDGFCVAGEDTAEFLEIALEKLGLTRREANEFIVFWLPLMEDNAYNLISFDTVAYEQVAKLHISPEPDTLIRVFMTWKASEEWVDLPKQELTAPERTGFVAVEWGGAMVESRSDIAEN